MDKPQNEISMAQLLGQLFSVTETFEMETQPQLLLLQKTMLVAEGTGRRLCPDANMWLLARPLIESWMAETLAPEARLRETVSEMAETLLRLPDLIRRTEQRLGMLAESGIQLDGVKSALTPSRTEAHLQTVLLSIIAGLLAFLVLVLA